MANSTSFKPGQINNPSGRPPGIKDRRLQIRAMFDDNAENLITTALELARQGDTKVLIACLDRISPKAKISTDDYISRPIPDLPTETPEQIQDMVSKLMSQAEMGERPLHEAETLVNMYKNMLDTCLKVKQDGEYMTKLAYIESKLGIEDDKVTALSKT